MKYKYLLFDADNTLLDFDAAEAEAFAQLDTLYPGKFSRDFFPVYHKENKLVWEKLERGEISRAALKKERFRRYAEKIGFDLSENDMDVISREYPNHLASETQLIDGATEVLHILSKSYPIYIITNGDRKVQNGRIKKSEVGKYITRMYISEEISFAKPDRRFFDAVMNDIGDVSPSSYLVIGDSLTSDIDGANSVGIDACFYSPQCVDLCGRTVKYNIKDLRELLHILL